MNYETLLLIIFVGICFALYLWASQIGYVDIRFLKNKIYIDAYILTALLAIAWYVLSIVLAIISKIRKLFVKPQANLDKKSIQELVHLILFSESENVSVPKPATPKIVEMNALEMCSLALLVKRGIPIPYKTGIVELDLQSDRANLQRMIQLNNVDGAIELAKKIIEDYPQSLSIVQDELLQIAIIARSLNKQFSFDPLRGKYKFDRSFIDLYLIKSGLIDVDNSPDVSTKLKLLTNLHKKFPFNTAILQQLLSTIVISNSNDSNALSLIQDLFKLNPNRKLATIFLQIYNKPDALEKAQILLKSIPDDNQEKLWFLITVATKLRLYQKIMEYLNQLIIDNDNYRELCVFYFENYNIMSAEPGISNLLCR